jgi:hypothetical protein
MAVHIMAAMRHRHFGQVVRRFKSKGLRDFHGILNKSETPLSARLLSEASADDEFKHHRRG